MKRPLRKTRSAGQIAHALDHALFELVHELEVDQVERLCLASSTTPHELAFLSTLANHLMIVHAMLVRHRTPQAWRVER